MVFGWGKYRPTSFYSHPPSHKRSSPQNTSVRFASHCAGRCWLPSISQLFFFFIFLFSISKFSVCVCDVNHLMRNGHGDQIGERRFVSIQTKVSKHLTCRDGEDLAAAQADVVSPVSPPAIHSLCDVREMAAARRPNQFGIDIHTEQFNFSFESPR